MKILIEKNDIICIKNKHIEVTAKNNNYCFDRSEIVQIDIITTDKGPFYDDMCLAIRINKESASTEEVFIFIMSEHPLYEKFLFDELKEIIDINYEAIIDASTCTESKVFMVYKK